MIFELDLRDRDVGGAVTGGILTDRVSGLSGPSAVDHLRTYGSVRVLTHGFNVSRADGRTKLANLAADLGPGDATAVLLVLWPGDHWTGALSYSFEGRDADASAVALARFLLDVNFPPATRLSFVTHSLGARVAMETIKRLDGRLEVDSACLMAPAVDDDCLADRAVYGRVVDAMRRVAVLSSREDEVLKYAYPVGDLLQAFLFWRDSAGYALGYNGPRNKSDRQKVPAKVIGFAIPDNRNADHGDYLWGLPDVTKTHEHGSAAHYARDVLQGRAEPVYPPRSGGTGNP